MMMPAYRTFVAIVENETLVSAAQALHTTQPTLTRQLQQIESDFGIQFFDRVGKKLVLNQAGFLVYQYAKQFVTLENRMQDELSVFMNPEVGAIRIGAGLTPSIYLLPQLFSLYRAKHPFVQFHVRSGSSEEVFTALLHGEIDLGVVTTLVHEGLEVKTVPLIRDDLLLVAPAGHPLLRSQPASIQEVAEYPVVLMAKGSGLRKIIDEIAGTHGFKWEMVTETDSLESINRLVQSGLGLSVLPRSSVQDDLLQGKLSVVALRDMELGARTITLISRSTGYLPAAASRFAEKLPELLGM
jgi:DNA-binding transcriptional LysR family regulator